ncbi:hypothetical protein ACFBZI_11145 [Moraxella sp. ZJ142]|uniref:hypothetical protein n=1 Tax=Moraxella marmotae TaxID=3344520 RepID=UPI0035D47081
MARKPTKTKAVRTNMKTKKTTDLITNFIIAMSVTGACLTALTFGCYHYFQAMAAENEVRLLKKQLETQYITTNDLRDKYAMCMLNHKSKPR